MKVRELFEGSVEDLPPEFRKEFTVDVIRKMREIAKKYGLIISTGSGGPIKHKKEYVGYTYHIFSVLHDAKNRKNAAPGFLNPENVERLRTKAVNFWKDVFDEFKDKYDLSSPVAKDGPEQEIDSPDQLMHNVGASSKLRFIYKRAHRDKHINKMQTYLQNQLNYIIANSFLSGTTEEYTQKLIKDIKLVIASEKRQGFTYPSIEDNLNGKNWKEQFRKMQLSKHQSMLKKNNEYYIRILISNLENDEKRHGFTHPELDFPKENRARIYWETILKNKNPTREQVIKHLLQELKLIVQRSNVHHSSFDNLILGISLARKAGLDSPELKTIETAINKIK